jgi:glycosyltransferase involved in cell wall biosynthesis
VSLAVIILTYNEERHIVRALECVRSVAREIFVVDSFSTDRTAELAREHGATVFQHVFVNHSKQFQWALDKLPISADWIMRLDADEVIEPDLAEEIRVRLPMLPPDVIGINLKRKHIFLGRWIRYGGRYPLMLLRIWRRGKGRIEDRWMDEHIMVEGGSAVTFDGGFSDHNLNDLNHFVNKHNKYATAEAIEIINQRYKLFARDGGLDTKSTSRQVAWKRLIKERIYNRIPFEIATVGYFLYRYFLRFGFLDGREGLVYHFLQGFWYRFLVGAKVRELERAIGGMREPVAVRDELARITGLKLSDG